MFYIIHALLGSLIGESFNSAWLILIISLISHFILDMIPHWDGYFNNKLFQISGRAIVRKSTVILHFIDFLFAVFLIIILYLKFDSKLMILGAVVSIFPDMIKVAYHTPMRKSKSYISLLKFHSKIQREVNWKAGLLTQLVVLFILLKIVF